MLSHALLHKKPTNSVIISTHEKRAQRTQWLARRYTAKMCQLHTSRSPSLFLPRELGPSYSLCGNALPPSFIWLAFFHSKCCPLTGVFPNHPSLKSPSPTLSATLSQESLNNIPQAKSAHHLLLLLLFCK